MKRVFLYILCVIVSILGRIEAQRLELFYITEGEYLFGGKGVWANLFIVEASLPTECVGLWSGGSLELQTISTVRLPNRRVSNDWLVFSNIDQPTIPIHLNLLGYTHQIGPVRIYFGLRSMNNDYFTSRYTSLFINSASGNYPTISSNYTCPNFPDAGMCLHINYQISEHIGIQNSLYNGIAYNPYQDGWRLFAICPQRDGLLDLLEVSYTSRKRLYGMYQFGGLIHTPYSVAGTTERKKTNYSVWLTGEQEVYRKRQSSVGILGQMGFAPRHTNRCYAYLGIGIIGTRLFDEQIDDRLCLMLNFAQFADRHETSLELSWLYSINKYLYIQPAINWIHSPEWNYAVGVMRVGATIEFKQHRNGNDMSN